MITCVASAQFIYLMNTITLPPCGVFALDPGAILACRTTRILALSSGLNITCSYDAKTRFHETNAPFRQYRNYV